MGRPKGSKNKSKTEKDLTNTAESGIICECNKKDIGTLVSYYYEGTRIGKLLKIKGLSAIIAPLPALGGAQPHTRTVPLKWVERIK